MRQTKIPKYKINDGEFNLAKMEISTIKRALKTAVCFEEASDLMGISSETLRSKILQYRIEECYCHIKTAAANHQSRQP